MSNKRKHSGNSPSTNTKKRKRTTNNLSPRLGQYYTSPCVRNICLALMPPTIFPDSTNETIFDLTMSSGGFKLL